MTSPAPEMGWMSETWGGGVFFWSGKKSEGEEEVEYEKRAPLVAVPRHGKSNRRLLFFEKNEHWNHRPPSLSLPRFLPPSSSALSHRRLGHRGHHQQRSGHVERDAGHPRPAAQVLPQHAGIEPEPWQRAGPLLLHRLAHGAAPRGHDRQDDGREGAHDAMCRGIL